MKIDMHVHCSGKRKPMRPNAYNPLDNYSAEAEEIMEHLKSQGITRGVILSGMEPENDNKTAMDIAARYPEFFSWMCNFTPSDCDTLEEQIVQCKAAGAIGVGELAVNQWIDSPFLTALFSAAQKLDMPVTFHMSPEPGYAYGICDKPGLPLLEQALARFPELKFLGHSQTFWLEISADCPKEGNKERSAIGRGNVVPGGRIEQLMEMYPNLYGDLSAYSGSCAIMRDEAYGIYFMERFADRLFFGTDTINKQQTYPLGAYLDLSVKTGKLSRETYEKICFKNAQRIFGI